MKDVQSNLSESADIAEKVGKSIFVFSLISNISAISL